MEKEDTQRRFSRIALPFPARLIVETTEVYDIRELANLSIGGCLVPLDAQIAKGASCNITIRLAGGLGNIQVNITGKAVRHDQDYVAIQFTAIAPDDLHHLQNLIRYNAPDPDQIEEEINSHPGIL
ncbi:MAG: PilZ domain-containing protein [Desulfopila sp.]